MHVHAVSVDDGAAGDPIPVDRPFVHIHRYRSVVRAETQVITIFQEHDGIIASQSSQALSTMALSTGSTSVGEDAITLRMLALPVW